MGEEFMDDVPTDNSSLRLDRESPVTISRVSGKSVKLSCDQEIILKQIDVGGSLEDVRLPPGASAIVTGEWHLISKIPAGDPCL